MVSGRYKPGRWVEGVRVVPVLTGYKVCSKCRAEKPLSSFNRLACRSDGRQSRCKVCDKEARCENPLNTLVRHLRCRFGITLAQYREMYVAQWGCCAVCGVKCPSQEDTHGGSGKRGSLVVDHDHVTGKVRGLLCTRCNTALGMLRDSPVLFASAVIYLSGGRVIHAQQSESLGDELGEKRSRKGKGQRASGTQTAA